MAQKQFLAKETIEFGDGTKAEFELSSDYAMKRYFDLRDITEQIPNIGRYVDGKRTES